MYRPITPADNLLSNKKITLLKIEYILRNIESFSVELISNKKYQYPRMGFLIKNVIPGLVLKLCTLIHNLYIFILLLHCTINVCQIDC